MADTTTMTIGCDLGDRTSRTCTIDAAGDVLERKRCATSRRGFRSLFEGQPPSRIVIEVGTHSPWVSALLIELGHEVIVANPRRVRLISANVSKTDDVDAELLARLGRVDPKLLAPIEHRGMVHRADLAIIRARAALVETRAKLTNHVRGVVKSNGERLPGCSTDAFCKRVEPVLPDELREALEPILKVIAPVTAQIKAYDQKIKHEMPKRYPEMDLLTQVNGVGPITALTFILTIEDPRRFSKSRKVGAYLGLRPRSSQSGNRDPELRITKAGSTYLRSLLVNCAQYTLGVFGTESDLRTWGLELASRGKKNAKKRAVVAVARKLAVLLHRLWSSGEPYQAVGYAETQRAG